MQPRDTFDLAGPLPTGTLVLEASAGTGKTHAIATLAARYIAEGVVTLPELMIVTFSRMATQELRDRVRGHLVTAATVVDEQQREGTIDAAEAASRRGRIRNALAGFDDATIATTHEFCDRMLAGLGILSDQDPGTTLVDNIEDLVLQVCTDLYIARYAALSAVPFSYDDAVMIGRKALQQPAVPLAPVTSESDDGVDVAALRAQFAVEVRSEVERRKRRLGIYTFDDMLTRLHASLTDEASGPAACRRLSQRYPVVLLDEFQDTDPVQWEILRRAFLGHSTMVLIGDPKQSIYGFRGADVWAYLEAIGSPDVEVRTLDRNHRTDEGVVRAIDRLFLGAALGDEAIRLGPVTAKFTRSRLAVPPGAPWERPMRVRMVPGERWPADFRPLIDADLTRDVVSLLNSGARFTDKAGTSRPLRASDIAVIVRSNFRGRDIQQALIAAGVPVVFGGATSVFDTTAARDWQVLLEALARPTTRAVRRASLTSLVGWTFRDLATASGDQIGELTTRIRGWARLLNDAGVAALYEVVLRDSHLPETLLAQEEGERTLTDLAHLAEALQAEQHQRHLTAPALAAWLASRITSARARREEERSRRLETDADAVVITTIHQAKGLEYPVVYLPEAADLQPDREKGQPFFLHLDGRRVLDVGGSEAVSHDERLARAGAESAGEELRGLYVSATRACSHLTLWWAESPAHLTQSPLHRLLFGERGPDGALPLIVACPPDPVGALDLAAAGIHIEVVEPAPVGRFLPPSTPVDELRLARFTRSIDRTWRRTSYSALTAQAHHGPAGELGLRESDEGDVDADAVPPADPAATQPSPMADLPGGTVFGTLVHAVFEHLQVSGAGLEADVVSMVAEQTARLPLPGVGIEALTAGLLPALTTPLGELAAGRCLADIPVTDRLAELGFELALGRAGSPPPTLADMADLIERHLAPDDPLLGYPNRLRAGGLGTTTLNGFLTGSIDAILRFGDPARHVVVDYKTNRLAGPDEPLTVGHYTSEAMAEAMMAAHYPLQALFYAVATHRFLRWRLPAYDPEVSWGGVLYLFVRGMSGPENPVLGTMGAGVFAWRPPAALVVDLSDLLAGSAATRQVTR